MNEVNSGLLTLAAKAGRLASEAVQEDKVANRLVRDPRDLDALSEAIVATAKAKDDIAIIMREAEGFLSLSHWAITHLSYSLWEQLWNESHPDQPEEVWIGEDFPLRSVCRMKVRSLVKDCGQELIFNLTPDEYADRLLRLGFSEEQVEHFSDWRSVIMHDEPVPSV